MFPGGGRMGNLPTACPQCGLSSDHHWFCERGRASAARWIIELIGEPQGAPHLRTEPEWPQDSAYD